MLWAQCEEHKDSNVTSLSTTCFSQPSPFLRDVGDATSKSLALPKDFLNASLMGLMGCGPSCWEQWFQWPCYQPGTKKVNRHFDPWGYSVMLHAHWTRMRSGSNLARGYRKKCAKPCPIVRNTGTPAALCLTLVWSRNQIRLGVATLQFGNDRNGAGRTASCHERLRGSPWYPLSSNLEPWSHPTSVPLPSSSILPSFSHKQTNRTLGHKTGLHRNGRHRDEIEHFQEENTGGAEGHLTILVGFMLLAGWWYLLRMEAARTSLWYHHLRKWL